MTLLRRSTKYTSCAEHSRSIDTQLMKTMYYVMFTSASIYIARYRLQYRPMRASFVLPVCSFRLQTMTLSSGLLFRQFRSGCFQKAFELKMFCDFLNLRSLEWFHCRVGRGSDHPPVGFGRVGSNKLKFPWVALSRVQT